MVIEGQGIVEDKSEGQMYSMTGDGPLSVKCFTVLQVRRTRHDLKWWSLNYEEQMVDFDAFDSELLL
jgi:hypothetical protein